MGRKLLSLLTAFALLLSLCATALAAGPEENSVRETNFFTSQPHTDLDFSEIEYERVDTDAILSEMDALRALLDDAENAGTVQERFIGLTDSYLNTLTMYSLAEIAANRDAADSRAAQELEAAYSACLTVSDALHALVRDILMSPCGDFLTEQLGMSRAAAYMSYHPVSQKLMNLSQQEAELESEYRQTAAGTFTAEYFGREWDKTSLNQAFYADHSIDESTYTEIYNILARQENEALGDIFLGLVRLRRSVASANGYSNYGDYAYRRLYGRDYSQQDMQSFHQAVKEYIVPLFTALQALSVKTDGVYYADYSGDIALDLMEPYIGSMSSELLEAFSYMRQHHLYDSDLSETKIDTGFTAMLYAWGAPFFFNAPANDLFDFTTTVHEFGHYNNLYWQEVSWPLASKDYDLLEVHSQGFELLFSHYYPDIFGKDADEVLNYQILSLVSAICEGAYYDELQQYIYSAHNVTLSQINEEAHRLSIEYGFAEEDSLMADVCANNWVEVSHNFTSPFYYISYAVSAAGAFTFWLDAQKDYFSAVDDYLSLTALDPSYGFQDAFEALDLPSPLSPGYLEELGKSLWQELDVSAGLEALETRTAFSDVSADSWYADYVLTLAGLGCIEGDENNAFHPNEPASWGMAMGALLSLTGQKPELNDGKIITRQEFCQMIAEVLDIPAAETPSPFTDTQDSAVAALSELGVISGYSDGTFHPDGSLTKAELCVILCRAAVAVAIVEIDDETAAAETTEETENNETADQTAA
ncbi:MAG: S-layer homology domain-containing protein [Oscillospiraceae bacterium]|nr:S-layer homology domain-containing protein [Oscillospiraceae bacterium]